MKKPGSKRNSPGSRRSTPTAKLKNDGDRSINRWTVLCGEGMRLVGVGGFIAGVFDSTLHPDFIVLATAAFAGGLLMDHLGGAQ